MVSLSKLAAQAQDLAEEHRDKVERFAEQGLDRYEDGTGRDVPPAVRDAVDRIDPDDGDGGRAPATGEDAGRGGRDTA